VPVYEGRGLAARLRAIWRTSEKFRFLAVGAFNTLFGYLTFVVLYMTFGQRINYLALLVVAHFIAVTNAFVGHRNVTFGAEGPIWQQFVRFNVSYLGVLALGLLATPVAVERFGMHPVVATALVTAITVVTSYFLHRGFSFRNR